MSISTKAVTDKITSIIASKTLNAAESAALSVSCNLDIQTSTWTGLPAAACNEGRFYYVTDCCGYHYSDGTAWQNSVDSTTATPANLIYSMGNSNVGQLGDNTTVSKSSPVSITGGFTSWCDVSAGYQHALGMTRGSIICSWGANTYGQLGDGTTLNKSSPTLILGGFTDWSQISASAFSNIAIRTDGTAWSWGCNGSGRLGDGTTVNKCSPVSVVGGFADWCQIGSGGSTHTAGIRSNGTAWAWGTNTFGQLGNGTTVNNSSPVSVVGGFTDWCQMSSGTNFTTTLKSDGTLWAWGNGSCGKLGDGTTVNKCSPVSVVGGFADWNSISNGTSHVIATRSNGTAWSWGCNYNGVLGDGTTVNNSSPVSVIGGFVDWCSVFGGNGQSIAIRTNGAAWTWGCNDRGQLGDGTTVNKSSPVSIVGGFMDWTKASVASKTAFLLRTRG